MNEIIDAINHNCSASGVAEIIKQILTFKRQFFLSMDKKTLNNKYSFTTNKKMRPLIFDNTPENVKRVPCVNVTLSERSAAYGSKNYNDFYSAISRKDLLRLCKLSEVDENFTIVFAFCGTEIPVKAKELVPILSEFSFLKAVKNFYKLKIVKASFLIDAVFLIIIFSAFYTGKIKPSLKAERAARALEARRISAIFSDFRETTEFAENGNIIYKVKESPKQHEYKYYDENGHIIREFFEKERGFLDIYRTDGIWKRENAIRSERFFEYDKKGNLVHSKGLKKETFYNFDSHLEFMNETFENIGDEAWYKYDSHGNRIFAMTTDTQTGNTKYDENGNQIHFNFSSTVKTWYEYDDTGNPLLKKSSDGTKEGESVTVYEYNQNGMLVKEIITSGEQKDETVVDYKYNDAGNLLSVKNSNGSGAKYEYNSDGKLSYYEATDSKGHRIEFKYYKYDDRGNIISFHDRNSEPEDWIFEYNSDNMLVYERGQNTDSEHVVYYEEEYWYMYDFYPNGNLKRIIRYFN